MALCTQTQVEQRLHINFTDDTDPVAAELIAAAQGHIERAAGRPLEAAAHTETFDPLIATVWLTHTPVNSITSVTVDGTALTSADYTWTENGRLTRTTSSTPRNWGTRKQQSVVIVYNGGYTTVPYDLQDVCANVAARAFAAGAAYASLPAGSEGIKQIMLAGSDSVTYQDTTATMTAAVGLTDIELDVVAYYRNPDVMT